MSKTLQLTFQTEGGSKSTISMNDPKEDLDALTLRAAMEDLVQSGVFVTKEGAYAAPYAAKYVERTVTEIFSDKA